MLGYLTHKLNNHTMEMEGIHLALKQLAGVEWENYLSDFVSAFSIWLTALFKWLLSFVSKFRL